MSVQCENKKEFLKLDMYYLVEQHLLNIYDDDIREMKRDSLLSNEKETAD